MSEQWQILMDAVRDSRDPDWALSCIMRIDNLAPDEQSMLCEIIAAEGDAELIKVVLETLGNLTNHEWMMLVKRLSRVLEYQEFFDVLRSHSAKINSAQSAQIVQWICRGRNPEGAYYCFHYLPRLPKMKQVELLQIILDSGSEWIGHCVKYISHLNKTQWTALMLAEVSRTSWLEVYDIYTRSVCRGKYDTNLIELVLKNEEMEMALFCLEFNEVTVSRDQKKRILEMIIANKDAVVAAECLIHCERIDDEWRSALLAIIRSERNPEAAYNCLTEIEDLSKQDRAVLLQIVCGIGDPEWIYCTLEDVKQLTIPEENNLWDAMCRANEAKWASECLAFCKDIEKTVREKLLQIVFDAKDPEWASVTIFALRNSLPEHHGARLIQIIIDGGDPEWARDCLMEDIDIRDDQWHALQAIAFPK